MKIMNYTRRDQSWQPGLAPASRDTVLETMLARLCENEFYAVNHELTHEGILKVLVERENRQSTALGEGIAFPHARLEKLRKTLFAVATFAEPVDFDGNPVRIVCLILAPLSDPPISLKIMAQISRMLGEEHTRQQVLAAATPEALRGVFSRVDPGIDKPILASDIMRLPRYSVQPEDPVVKCSHLMSVNGLLAVPVVDGQHRIVGQVTVERLFRYGLPEFFEKLKSVSFIAEFDPFEKYFADERSIRVCDVMEENARTVPMDYTIMEAVFDLAIKGHPKLYVVNGDERWVGTIDKGLVLDNVINH